MNLYQHYDRLIAAYDEDDALNLLREQMTAQELRRELKRCPLALVTGNVDLQFMDKDAKVVTRSYAASEAAKLLRRGIVPEGE